MERRTRNNDFLKEIKIENAQLDCMNMRRGTPTDRRETLYFNQETRRTRQTEPTTHNKTNRKNNRRNNRKRKPKIKGATKLALVLGIEAIGLGIVVPRAQQAQLQKTIAYERQVRAEIEKERNEKEEKNNEINSQINEKIAEINKIDLTKDAILKNIKEIYVEEYNLEHEQDIDIEQLKLMCADQDYIYMLEDGKYLTHGDYPKIIRQDMEEKKLEYKGTIEDQKVYYSSIDGETIEMITNTGRNGWVSVYDGNKICYGNGADFYEYMKNDNNTFLQMKDVLIEGITWANEPENKTLKENYIEAVKESIIRDKEKTEEEQTQVQAELEDQELEM